MTIGEIAALLERWFPLSLAQSWDNVGLLLGDPSARVDRLMTCLTVTPASSAEALQERADVVISHHPIFFRPIQRLTADGAAGIVYHLARAGIGVYSPHTAFDSAAAGINQQIAERLGLTEIRPLRPGESAHVDQLIGQTAIEGVGRWGRLPASVDLDELARRVRQAVGSTLVQVSGDAKRSCRVLAIGCGAAGELLDDAQRCGCDVFLTGEARFHDALRAEQLGMGMILAGHFATERFAVEVLAARLAAALPGVTCWTSRCETDPWRGIA